MIEVSYSEARARLAELLARVSDDREVVRIRRQGSKPDAVLIDADEYASLAETAHLLSSPANLRHLVEAVVELESGAGDEYASVDALWADLEARDEGVKTVDLMSALRESIRRAREIPAPPPAAQEPSSDSGPTFKRKRAPTRRSGVA